MRKVKNITVCVTPEIYRQARHLAAEYDTTVSAIVAWLLPRLPAALERTRFPKGGPKPSLQPAPPPAAPTPSPFPDLPTPTPTLTPGPSEKTAISGCETVTPSLTNDLSAACSHSADVVTAPVQLCDERQVTHNERLIISTAKCRTFAAKL